MRIYKQNLIAFLSIIFFYNCSSVSTNSKGIIYNYNNRIDTIQGYFLYEVNVPLKCFTRFDQIEQGNNLIFFDSLINKKGIDKFYQKGVFFYQYQPVIDRYINETKIGIAQNKQSINAFNLAINYSIHMNDSLYNKTLYYDSENILTYKKVYAKFSFRHLGGLEQLVPKTQNYICCYSNKKEKINSFFIVDIFSFKLM